MLAGFSRIGNVASFVGVSCGLVERETKYRGTSPPILANAPRRHRQMDKQVCRSLTCQQPSQKKNTALHQWRIISILQPCHRVLTLQILSTLQTFEIKLAWDVRVSKLRTKIKEMHLKAISSNSNAAPTTWIKTETVSPLQNYSNISRLLKHINTNQAQSIDFSACGKKSTIPQLWRILGHMCQDHSQVEPALSLSKFFKQALPCTMHWQNWNVLKVCRLPWRDFKACSFCWKDAKLFRLWLKLPHQSNAG